MVVPKFFEFFKGFLLAVNDGELHTAREVRETPASYIWKNPKSSGYSKNSINLSIQTPPN